MDKVIPCRPSRKSLTRPPPFKLCVSILIKRNQYNFQIHDKTPENKYTLTHSELRLRWTSGFAKMNKQSNIQNKYIFIVSVYRPWQLNMTRLHYLRRIEHGFVYQTFHRADGVAQYHLVRTQSNVGGNVSLRMLSKHCKKNAKYSNSQTSIISSISIR